MSENEAQPVVSAVLTFYNAKGCKYHRTVEYNRETGKFRVDGKSEAKIEVELEEVLSKLKEAIEKEYHVGEEMARDVIKALTTEGYEPSSKAGKIAKEMVDSGFASDLVESLTYIQESYGAFSWLIFLDHPYETISSVSEN